MGILLRRGGSVETREDPTEHPERGSDPDSCAREETTKELLLTKANYLRYIGNVY